MVRGHLPCGPRAKPDIYVFFRLYLAIEMANRQNLFICIFFSYEDRQINCFNFSFITYTRGSLKRIMVLYQFILGLFQSLYGVSL